MKRLREIGQYLQDAYGTNLLDDSAVLTAAPGVPGHGIDRIRSEDESCYLPACEGEPVCITIEWPEEITFRRIVLMEQIALSQRVERYAVDALVNGQWQEVAAGKVIGYKRIVTLPPTTARSIRIRIEDARIAPTLKFTGIYA